MLEVNRWYETQSGSFVQIIAEEPDGIFVGSFEGKLLMFNQEGKAHYPTSASMIEAPEIYNLKSVEAISPPIQEYLLQVSIKATIKIKIVSIGEASSTVPDMLDVSPLSRDLEVYKINAIKVESGYLLRPERI